MSKMAAPLRIAIDRRSSVPAYRQLAEELRYRIATGNLGIGARLPTVANGGKIWGVNLHTVRRAYEVLASEGLVEMQRGRGTIVIAKAPASPAPAREGIGAFAEWAAAHASREFGLMPAEFADLIAATRSEPFRARDVPIVECSEHQADQLARLLQRRWQAETRGWSLERAGEPPAGPFVATLFHYNDIRRRWPHRMKDAIFISIHPSGDLREKLKSFGKRKGPVAVRLVERDEPMARSIAADVSTLLPSPRYRLETYVFKGPVKSLSLSGDEFYLFSPRLWADLSKAQHALPNTADVEYVIADDEQMRVAHRFGWQARDER